MIQGSKSTIRLFRDEFRWLSPVVVRIIPSHPIFHLFEVETMESSNREQVAWY